MSQSAQVPMSEAPTTPDREHPRYEVDIWVDFSTLDIFTSSYVTNLSRGGLFIRSEKPLPLDSEVKMVLWLPGHTAIRARGRVVWNYDIRRGTTRIVPGNGIRFTDIPIGDRELLTDYIGTLSKSAGRDH